MSSKTQFPDDVFRLIKSFTKPNVWCCDSCDEEFNMKEQRPEYINGFDLFKTFKSQIFVYCILLCGLFISLLTENFSIPFYVSILIIDIFIMILLYKIIIIKDIHKHVKGG